MTPNQQDYFECANRILANTEVFKSSNQLFRLGVAAKQNTVSTRCDSLIKLGYIEKEYRVFEGKRVIFYRRLKPELTLKDYERELERRANNNRYFAMNQTPRQESVTNENGVTRVSMNDYHTTRRDNKSPRVYAGTQDYGSF